MKLKSSIKKKLKSTKSIKNIKATKTKNKTINVKILTYRINDSALSQIS